MSHSKVFTDGEYCVVLVSHVRDVNEISDNGVGLISGLLEYAVDLESGELFVYDPDDEELYSEHDLETDTLDQEALRDLVDAIDGGSAEDIGGSEYYDILARYRHHPVGTIVRVEYSEESDAFVKRGEDYWEVTGGFTSYTDEEIESEDYEVIYSV